MRVTTLFIGLAGLLQFMAADAFSQWVQMTPQYGTSVLAIAQTDSVILAGMDNGAFVSTDSGSSWRSTTLSGVAVRAIFQMGATTFAGTDNGVYISNNQGMTWKQSGMASTRMNTFCSVGSRIFSGTNGQGIFVTADSGGVWQFAGLTGKNIEALGVYGGKILATSLYSGVYASTDTGKTWSLADSGITTSSVDPLVVAGGVSYLGTDVGVFISYNGGVTWSLASMGWAHSPVEALACWGDFLIAGTASNGIWYSTDSGSTWTPSNLISGTSVPVQIISLASSGSTLFAGASTVGLAYYNSRISGVYRSTDGGKTWTAQGLNSSRVWAIASDGKYLYQGTEGGLFRSADAGVTWVAANDGLTWPLVGAIAISDSGVFVGTRGEYGGVYRSTNAANSWTLTGLSGRQVYCLAANNSILLAGGPAGSAYSGGLFISTDNGGTWGQSINRGALGINSAAIGDTNLFATDLNNQGIFVSTDRGASWQSQNGGSSIAIIGKNIFVGAFYNTIGFLSTDNGMTWSQTVTPGDIYAMAVSHDTIFAATDHGIFGSANLGSSWTDVGPGLTQSWFYSIAVANGYVYAGSSTGEIWRRPLSQMVIVNLPSPTLVSPKNNSTLTSDSVAVVWNSVRGATSYRLQVAYDSQFKSIFLEAGQVKDTTFAVEGLSSNTIFYWRVTGNNSAGSVSWSPTWSFHAGVDTSNQAKSWVNVGVLGNSAVRALASYKGALFAGTYYDGVFRSTDNGLTWQTTNVGLIDSSISSLAASDSGIYAGAFQDAAGVTHAGVYRSTDNGSTWMPTGMMGRMIYCLAANDTFVLAGGPAGTNYMGGLFVSTDNGGTWTQSINRGNLGMNSVAIGDTNFFATDLNNLGIFVSTDNGYTWRSQNGGSSIVTIGTTVYVGAFYNSIGFLSTDNGRTWTETATPGDVYGLASGNGEIFAATDHGVFGSSDQGKSWVDISGGLTDRWIWSIAVSNGYLFVGSDSGYVWRRPLENILTGVKQKTLERVPETYTLEQNYPNPFNPTTTIRFNLQESSTVTLQVYDMVGQLVESFQMGTMGAGSYGVTLDMSHFASGVYFYRIDAVGLNGDRFTSAKKMVLTK